MIFSITLLIKVQVFSTSHNSTASSCMCCQRITSHLISWDARTRLQRRRTRVRCGDVRGTSLTTHRCQICHVVSFFFCRLAPTQLRLGPICVELGWFVPTQVVSTETGETTEMACSSWNGRFRPKFKHSLSLHHSSLFSVLFAMCVCSASLNHSLPLCLYSPSRGLQNNTTQMLLCWPVTKSCNIKRLWLPQNALCFVFYWTPSCTQSHVAVLVILPWCTRVGWDGYGAWSNMAWLGERVGHFFFVLCFFAFFFLCFVNLICFLRIF